MPMPQRKKFKAPPIRVPNLDKHTTFSYTDYQMLAKFVSEQGYIAARSRTSLTQKQQRNLTRAIKRARHLALLPFTQTV